MQRILGYAFLATEIARLQNANDRRSALRRDDRHFGVARNDVEGAFSSLARE
jgi:hypothetical protein